MKVAQVHSHLNGLEYLHVHRPKLWAEIESVIKALDAVSCKTKISRAKRIVGLTKYSTKALNRAFSTSLSAMGWHERRKSSWVTRDFVKERVALEVQLGKYAFVAYDLFVKHLAFYVRDEIDVGIEILPMKSMQAEMSSGPGYYEGEVYNVIRNGRGVPSVPLVIVGIEP
jgi:hypothetical protein